MEESYRARMVTSVKLDAERTRNLLELQKKIKKLEEIPEVKQYLELKFLLNTLSQISVGRDEKIEEEKSYVFDDGCVCQNCIWTDYSYGYIHGVKTLIATFYCLDCGATMDISEDKLEQFKKEHKIINVNPLGYRNYEIGTNEALRDYYFNLLMNYSSEEALRIFTLTYEEILESRKINSDSVSR